jgi:hypothetical protein
VMVAARTVSEVWWITKDPRHRLRHAAHGLHSDQRSRGVFATEAYIHHMCTVANLIKTCCFEGAAYDLVTSLGPERFTEWKSRR